MHMFTPVLATPNTTQAAAADALQRLARVSTSVSEELTHLPSANPALLDALATRSADQVEHSVESLLQQIDRYWRSPSATGQPRRTLLTAQFKQSLHDEAILKSHEKELLADAAQWMAFTGDEQPVESAAEPSFCSLHVQLNEQTQAQINGALVISAGAARTFLWLPGSGLTEFPTQLAMLQTVARWLNDSTLRWAILISAEQRYQDAVFATASDPALSLEAFTAEDVRLQLISGDPYRHVLQRLIEKQRNDARYLCAEGLNADPLLRAQQIELGITMPGLLGPAAMLARREQVMKERALRAAMPDWLKIASPEDLQAYSKLLQAHDSARQALSSALGAAASAEHFAITHLNTRIADDLGYDLDARSISLQTERTLPVTGEKYLISRSLPELALFGLHPDDARDGSPFRTKTRIYIDTTLVGIAHAALTPTYLQRLINDLNLRAGFGDYQREAYAKPANQQLMCDVFDAQLAESAYAAKLQGHLTSDDYAIVKTMCSDPSTPMRNGLSVQHLSINASGSLARILVVRKQSAEGTLERLIMFTSDAPRSRMFYSFDTETQLLHDIVEWANDSHMSEYLLEQLPTGSRERLAQTLEALRLKPLPEPGFLQWMPLDSYETALRTLITDAICVTLANQHTHSPRWYADASLVDRQTLVELEDASAGAISQYEAKDHTHVPDFDAYVHERASEKISQLLNVPLGSVDPDRIIIRSERETLTYTAMMRDGYDDSIDLTTPTADTVATFEGPQGVDLSALTPARVAGSVRGTWLADAYASLIKRTLLDPQSTGYEYRRKTSTLIVRLQMQAAALRSRLKGHIDAIQYQWLEHSLAHLHRSQPETRARFPVYPLHIHIDKPFIASHLTGIDQIVITDTHLTHIETVQGCFALLPTEPRLAALLYTPDAPDGIEFRVFSSFTESLQSAGMIDYYKDRCRTQARRILSFFLNDMKQGNANKSPTLPRDHVEDVSQIFFNRPIERKLREVDEATTGRHDMLSALIWNSLDVIASVVTLPFPPASFAVGVAMSLRDNFKAIQALSGHSPDAAGALILTSVLNAAGAAGDLHAGLKGFGGVARKLAKDAPSGVRPAALKPTSLLRSHRNLHPVNLQDETFFIAKANARGQAAVYRSAGLDSDAVHATRHYLVRSEDGGWRPLGEATESAPAITGVDARRAVNISVQDMTRITEGHGKGISLSNGKCYIQINDKVFQVHYDASQRCWNIVDPGNPFAFFGRQPVWLDEHDQWHLIERSSLRGGGNDLPGSYKPIPSQGTSNSPTQSGLQDYELPKNMRQHIDQILTGSAVDPMGYGMDEFFEVYYAQMRQRYFELREHLYRDARDFFAQPMTLPPRPELPAIDASTTLDGFLQGVFGTTNGLVMSEAPKSIASKRLLILNMQTLAEQRVEVLYLPHVFTDKHLRKLAKYHLKGSKVRSGSHEIKDHLEYLNNRALDNQSREYDYYHLIKAAHRHNIEVRPISSAVSYPVDGFAVTTLAEDSTTAQKMSNFFAHHVISADIAADPSKRWIALMDQHLATTHDQIPGIAQMEGAISVHIQDVPSGHATRIAPGSPLVDTGSSAIPSDFKIEFANSTLAEPAPLHRGFTSTDFTVPDPGEGGVIAEATNPAFRWDPALGWAPVPAHDQLVRTPLTAVQQSLADAAYELPSESRTALYELAYFKRRGLDSDYFFFDEGLTQVQNSFFDLRRALQKAASRTTSIDLPPRPMMPSLTPQPNLAQFLQDAYEHTNGVVIGEFHASIGSKQLIMDNIALLKAQNVKTLYMEHMLTDLHQLDLDSFFDTGQMSERLLHALQVLDRGHLTDPAKVYTFEKLVIQAQREGIEIRAIDCAASYHLKGLRSPNQTTRQQMMNYFASRTIRKHQAVMGEHKWVALVGNSHSNTYKRVPGLAELEGAIGVRVDDVVPGTSKGITRDSGETARLAMSTQEGFVKGDFKIEIEVSSMRPPVSIRPPQALPLEQRLSRPGLFVTEQEEGVHVIVHRSRDSAIHRTPVQANEAGKVFVDRPTWSAVHLQPYDDIDALVSALEDINLTRVG